MAQHPFAEKLLSWYRINKRDLPWRNTTDPYAIWLSETILQQTRVAQGLPYYERFINTFPTLEALANANDDRVMKLWQGLGYYSRARNMLKAARHIQDERNGEWPTKSGELQKLSGVGPYTAAAIASFAFDESVPVIDGNVYRVVSRYLDIASDISESAGKKEIQHGLNAIFDPVRSAEFNQAIMELGAMVCTPKNPNCSVCPVADSCSALHHQTVGERPVKTKKTKIRDRYLEIFVISINGKVALTQRPKSGIWSNLWTFPFIEFETQHDAQKVTESHSFQELIGNNPFAIQKKYSAGTHLLSHRRLHLRYWEVDLESSVAENVPNYRMISWDELHTFAVPKPIETFLKNRGV